MLTILKLLITSAALSLASIATAQSPYNLTHADQENLSRGKAVTHVWHDQTRTDRALDIFGAIDVMASPDVIWNIMTDCSRGNDLVKGMLSCELLDSDVAAKTDIREQVFDMGLFLPNIKTRFKSDYIPLQSITITRIGGDLKIQEAMWTITPLEKGLTRVTYRGTILLKFPVPRGVLKNATRKDTPQIMKNLRRAAQADYQKQRQMVKTSSPITSKMP